MFKGGSVVVDGAEVFEAYLSKTDGRKKTPTNATIQMVHVPKKGRRAEAYHIFLKVGDTVETYGPFPTQAKAKTEFENLYSEKTGNDWSNRASFTVKKGCFNQATAPPAPSATTTTTTAAAAAPTARRGRSATNSLPAQRPSTPSPPPAPVQPKRGRKATTATLPPGPPVLVSTPSTTQAGCIDAVAQTLLPNADVVVHGGDIYDVALAQVEISTNTDKYYIIQVLVNSVPGQPDAYYVFLRWGRTGSNGQNQLLGVYATVAEAIQVFEEKFEEKTQNAWSRRKSFKKKKGFYELLRVDHANKANRRLGTGPVAKWEYYVDDHVDGKATGKILFIYFFFMLFHFYFYFI